jgi:nitrogen regulatory protein PII
MKIQAVMAEANLPAVLERLALIGVDDVVVSQVRIEARAEEVRSFRGARYWQELVDRCSVECWPDEDAVEPVTRAIRQAVEKNASEATIIVSDAEEFSSST